MEGENTRPSEIEGVAPRDGTRGNETNSIVDSSENYLSRQATGRSAKYKDHYRVGRVDGTGVYWHPQCGYKRDLGDRLIPLREDLMSKVEWFENHTFWERIVKHVEEIRGRLSTELDYSGYKHNRNLAATPEDLALVYGQRAEELEARFQAEVQSHLSDQVQLGIEQW